MYGVWCHDTADWLREPRSKMGDGGVALLVFENKDRAKERAASHYGAFSYQDALQNGWCEVRTIQRVVEGK